MQTKILIILERMFSEAFVLSRPGAYNFIIKETHRCFPVNFAKFIRTPFFTEHLRRLLLCFQKIAEKIAEKLLFFHKSSHYEVLEIFNIKSKKDSKKLQKFATIVLGRKFQPL